MEWECVYYHWSGVGGVTVSIETLRSIITGYSSVCPARQKTVHHVKNNSLLTPNQKSELIKYCLCIHCELARFCTIQKIFVPTALPFLLSADQNIHPTGYPKMMGLRVLRTNHLTNHCLSSSSNCFYPLSFHSIFMLCATLGWIPLRCSYGKHSVNLH